MSKIKYTENFPQYHYLESYFESDFDLVDFSRNSAEYFDIDTHGHIIFGGSGFHHSGEKLDKGTIEKISFEDQAGNTIAVMTNVQFDAESLVKTLYGKPIEVFLARILSGNDEMIGTTHGDNLLAGAGNDDIFGGKGEDSLYGAAGKDRMDGGDGSDWFVFTPGSGRDTVVDFDADGGGANQDYIAVDGAAYSIIDAGENTVIKLSSGDRLTLLHVNESHITTEDFVS